MTNTNQLNIIITDDHSLFLEGITALISSSTIKVVGNFKNGQEVLDFLKTQKVDLVISDINMPVMDGITLAKKAKKLYHDTKVMMLSMYEEKYIMNKALNAGADGYMSKNAGKKEILNAIERCMSGEKVTLSSSNKFTQKSIKHTETSIKKIILTGREREILKLVTEERNNTDISLALDISKRTVETHKKNMILKLGVTNTVGLIKMAIKKKIFK